ncbi:hypothetical protein CUC15_07105 [Oceanobacillus zhaokaii]|jgi:hypothetical protein|uniref:YhzD-like protein n=1 Tax=Oceanobacillus zhaokaii TaxID=2052660 RepID=A0A345PFB4_9BACI|nr:YhzD family protein [Oceanobacillus zhaokaii]AXI08694.1 hypothetical protein CUC15_07105 [Oceanobacillus zhaokaii]
MADYFLTVFDKSGKKLYDKSFSATDNSEAKEIGLNKLKELEFNEHTHRCVTADGKLVLFQR